MSDRIFDAARAAIARARAGEDVTVGLVAVAAAIDRLPWSAGRWEVLREVRLALLAAPSWVGIEAVLRGVSRTAWSARYAA